MSIESVVFDLFGVVVAFDDRLVYDRLSQHCRYPIDAMARMTDLVSDPDLIRGRKTLDELHAQLSHDVGLSISFPDFKHLWTQTYSEPMPGIRELLNQLQGQCRLVLLSNVDGYYWPTVSAQVPELGKFDCLLTSFEQGVAKPEVEAFMRAVKAAGVAAEHCLFVDDKSQNVDAATSLGLLGHKFRSTQVLKAELRANGLRVE